MSRAFYVDTPFPASTLGSLRILLSPIAQACMPIRACSVAPPLFPYPPVRRPPGCPPVRRPPGCPPVRRPPGCPPSAGGPPHFKYIYIKYRLSHAWPCCACPHICSRCWSQTCACTSNGSLPCLRALMRYNSPPVLYPTYIAKALLYWRSLG
jgi:hypothetical protein